MRLLRLVIVTDVYLGWLWVVNVPDPEPNPAHANDLVLLELEALGFECLVGVLVHYEPQFLFRIGVDAMEVNLVLVVDPVALAHPFFLLGFLVHDAAELRCLLVLFVQVHSRRIRVATHLRILSCQDDQDLLCFLPVASDLIVIEFDDLLMPE